MLDAAVQQTAAGSMQAESTVRTYLARNSDSAEALWLLGNLQLQQGNLLAAAICYQRIPINHPQHVAGQVLAGDQYFKLNDPTGAEAAWLEALKLDAENIEAAKRLLAVYGLQTRREEWKNSLWNLIESGHGELRELVQLMIVDYVVWRGEGAVDLLEKFVAASADDRRSRTSLVHHLLAAGRIDEARSHLAILAERRPWDLDGALAALAVATAEADAAYFESLFADEMDRTTWNDVAAWRRGLGELDLIRGRPKSAVEHFLFAASREPFHPHGRQQLAVALRLLNRTKESEIHARAANVLARIERSCHAMQTAHSWTDDGVLELARDAASVGMIAEAKAWLQFALRNGSSDARIKRLLKRLGSIEETSSLRPPGKFLDPVVEASHW